MMTAGRCSLFSYGKTQISMLQARQRHLQPLGALIMFLTLVSMAESNISVMQLDAIKVQSSLYFCLVNDMTLLEFQILIKANMAVLLEQ